MSLNIENLYYGQCLCNCRKAKVGREFVGDSGIYKVCSHCGKPIKNGVRFYSKIK